MNGVIMMVIAIVVLGGGYLFYGRYLEKKWGIDPNAKTPAYELEDGVDYVPADTNIVFGHQFASIAGAGPINGPIQAKNLWMASGTFVDSDRRCFLRSSAGFCIHVCFCKEQRTYNRLYYRRVYR